MNNFLKSGIFVLAASALMLMAGQVWADGVATVSTAQSAQYGIYLVDSDGMTLYLFESDVPGSGQSSCHNACAIVWPPFLTEGSPVASGQAMAGKLGTIQREDGTTQVTYNGWPLYYFSPDQNPGDMVGQGAQGFGAGWYVVTPQGEAVDRDDDSGESW